MIFESELFDFFYDDVIAIDRGGNAAETGVVFFATGSYLKIPKEIVAKFADDWKNFIGEQNVFTTDRFVISYADVRGFDKSGELPFTHTILFEGGGFTRLTPKDGDLLNERWKNFHRE